MSFINQTNAVPDNMDIFLAIRNQVVCSQEQLKKQKQKQTKNIYFLQLKL